MSRTCGSMSPVVRITAKAASIRRRTSAAYCPRRAASVRVRQPFLDRNNVLHSENTIPDSRTLAATTFPARFRCQLLAARTFPGNEFAANAGAQAPVWRRSTMRVRWIWPVAAVRGRASTTARRRGCLKGASRPSQNARRASRSGGVGARPDDDHRGHDLAPLRVGDADDRDLGDGRVRGEHRFDLGRRDRLAAGADHVAGAADDRQVALVVERAEIAGVVPAVAQRLGGRRRDRRSSRPSGTGCACAPRRSSASRTSTPGCATPTLPGFAEEVGVAELHARSGFGRAVEHAGLRCGGARP